MLLKMRTTLEKDRTIDLHDISFTIILHCRAHCKIITQKCSGTLSRHQNIDNNSLAHSTKLLFQADNYSVDKTIFQASYLDRAERCITCIEHMLHHCPGNNLRCDLVIELLSLLKITKLENKCHSRQLGDSGKPKCQNRYRKSKLSM